MGHANWCNVRVSVFGPREAVARFMTDAGHGTRGIDISRSTVFLPEMEVGEGGDLSAKEPATFGRRWHSSSPFGDPNADSHGSYLLQAGRQRAWKIPARLHRD